MSESIHIFFFLSHDLSHGGCVLYQGYRNLYVDPPTFPGNLSAVPTLSAQRARIAQLSLIPSLPFKNNVRAQKYPVWVRLAEHYPGNGPR